MRLSKADKDLLKQVIDSKHICHGFKSHARELLAGGDPTGGIITKQGQMAVLSRQLNITL